ncbi:MAG: 1-acyl-sn-glycerol-3-phosphate acyltransferase [Candidatus Aureabacteria bacterium]|nr:1-acyl-sn-glycerol-3-phosphate acyltransferase [Candidatus Auribacterota bacterium]
MIAIIKLILSLSTLVIYLFFTLLGQIVIWDDIKKRCYFMKCKKFFSKWLIKIFNVKLVIENFEKSFIKGKNYFIISNHQSYLDHLIISSIVPVSILANSNIKKKKFLWALTWAGGNLFIERKKRAEIKKEISKIKVLLKNKINMLLYPEGTTSDGITILPFKSSLIQPAIDVGVDFLPVCIKYAYIDGKKCSAKDMNTFVYHGEMKFFKHLIGILRHSSITVKVTFLGSINASKGYSRKIIAGKAYDAIKGAFAGDNNENI